MLKKRLILLLVVTLLFPSLQAENQLSIRFISPNHQLFTDYFLTLKFTQAFQQEQLNSSIYTITLPPGTYQTEAILDSFNTPTADYYGAALFTFNNTQTIEYNVYPIGYVQGTVLDSKGNLIPSANLQFHCLSTIAINYPEKTDNTGFFSVPNIPIGACTLIASRNNDVGEVNILVRQGQSTSVQIKLEQKVTTTPLSILLFSALIPLIIILLLIWLIISYKRNKSSTPNKISSSTHQDLTSQQKEESTDETSFSTQTRTLLETLNENEKKITLFLLENNNESSQSKIRHGTKIARTSLTRILQSLERKKLVQIEKDGKIVTIRLTGIFLGK